MTSSIRIYSPDELLTTADRIALAPLGTPTSVGLLPNSDGMAHTDPCSDSTLALIGVGGRVAANEGKNALTTSGDHATVAKVAMEASSLMIKYDVFQCL
jgi:hypothetical protein